MDLATKTIREIALEAPATTRVFEQFNIDYCCGGRRSIEEACAANGIDRPKLMEDLERAISVSTSTSQESFPEDLRPTELIEYIVGSHHSFTTREVERLTPLMAKVARRHGAPIDIKPERKPEGDDTRLARQPPSFRHRRSYQPRFASNTGLARK